METVKTNGHSKQAHFSPARRPARRRITAVKRPTDPDAYSRYLEKQLAALLDSLCAVRDGDLSTRLPTEGFEDVTGEVAWAVNGLFERSEAVVREVGRVSRVVGREGRAAERASIGKSAGDWASCIDGINAMIGEVGWRTQEVARIVNDVSEGDLSHKMTLEYEGRPLQGDALKISTAVNQLVDRLRLVSSEVTRVAREVGTEGKLGGQAEVKGVSGTWKDLTDNVNLLAGNLTTQGAQHRPGRRPAWSPTATSPRRSPSMPAARSSSSRTPSTPWWSSCGPLPRK